MVSEFRRRKYLEVFKTFDSDASGTIEKKDVEKSAEMLAKQCKVDEAKQKEYLNTMLKIWDGLQSQADLNKDGHVTVDEWVALWDSYAKNPSSAHDWQNLYCKFTFQLLDTGNDGLINREEFVKVHEALGVNKNEAEDSFQKLSKGKASISLADFQELWKEYFTSEDAIAPGNFIFGFQLK
ncbi:unnamed protein product [Parnassius mnemosyne]|uniref:EF-hand domain-containing protein n=1 Tax=Parnassius mnemosyne TaxID=213953 RepID=A0AAV1KPD4_9NEOP